MRDAEMHVSTCAHTEYEDFLGPSGGTEGVIKDMI